MNAVQSAFSSPRFNRYLLWAGVVVLALGVVAVVVKFAGGSDNSQPASPDKGFHAVLPKNSAPLKNEQGATIKTYAQLDGQIRDSIKTFIDTAVARQHVERSWNIVSPDMKAGYTPAAWKKATALPIVPYPGVDTKATQYYLDYATNREILIEVGLAPKPGVTTRPTTFQLGLVPMRNGSRAHWVINYWMPRWTPPVPNN